MRIVIRSVSLTTMVFAGLLASASAAEAQLAHVYLDPVAGSNANDCGAPADPCRTLNAAIARGQSGSNFYFLKPGFYGGGANLTYSADFNGVPGAVIGSPDAPCLTFDPAGNNAFLNISNLVCDQRGAVEHGIVVAGGKTVRFDRVFSRNIGGNRCAARFAPAAGGIMRVMINDSGFTEHSATAGNANGGLCFQPTNNTNIDAVVRNTLLQNVRNGISATAGQDGFSIIFVDGSEFSENTVGIFAGRSSSFCVRNSTFSRSFSPFVRTNGGTVFATDENTNAFFNNGNSPAFDGPCPAGGAG